MQCRRWWLTVLAVGAMAALNALPSRAATVDDYAKEMVAGKKPATQVRMEFEADKSFPGKGDPKRNQHVKDTVKAFGSLITHTDPLVSLNATIVVSKLDDIDIDATMIASLKHSNPAVRYWAAKGLSSVLTDLKKIRASYIRAIDALKLQLAAETSAVVKAEITKALAGTDEAAESAAGLQRIADGFAAAAPSSSDVIALRDAIVAVNEMLARTPAPAQQTAILTGAAHALSYAAQHDNVLKNADPKAVVGSDLANVSVAFVDLLKTCGDKSGAKPVAASANWLVGQFDLDRLTGSATTPGTVQALDKAVPLPKAVAKPK